MSDKPNKGQEIAISKIEIKVSGITLKLTPEEAKKLYEALGELFSEKQSPNIFINNTPLIIWREHYNYPWQTYFTHVTTSGNTMESKSCYLATLEIK